MAEISAYAKINLFLDIQNLRKDGYHNITSVMQTVDWCDKITLEKNNCGAVRLSCNIPDIPLDHTNTVHKAISAFLDFLGEKTGVDIFIEKYIPHSAGMAGGSADAAAVLRELNRFFGAPLSSEQLIQVGKKIGADVPFCLVGGTKLTTGIGEILSPFPVMPPCFIVCTKPNISVSTPNAYAALDKLYRRFEEYQSQTDRLNRLRSAVECQDLSALSDGMFNIFESVVCPQHPEVDHLKIKLKQLGALATLMSGSGPSVFGIFDDGRRAERACGELQRHGINCRVCIPINSF